MRKTNQGSVLIMAMIILLVIGVVFSITSNRLLDMLRGSLGLRSETQFKQMRREIDFAFQHRPRCHESLKDPAGDPVIFPAAAVAGTTVDLGQIFVASQPILMLDTFANSSQGLYNPYFQIDRMTFKNTSFPKQSGRLVRPDDSVYDADRYFVELVIEGRHRKGSKSEFPFRMTMPMSIFVNQADRSIETCQSDTGRRVLKALAGRLGVSIAGKTCTAAIPGGKLNELVVGKVCVDANLDGLCDGDVNYTPDTNPHPFTGANPSQPFGPPDVGYQFFQDHFPGRDAVLYPPPLTEGPSEGRCLVQLGRNDSDEDPDQIFRLCNKDDPDFPCPGIAPNDGIGCNNSNGWFLSYCGGKARGISDTVATDASKVTIDGDQYEFCEGSGYTTPHGTRFLPQKGWLNLTYSIEVTCEKIIN